MRQAINPIVEAESTERLSRQLAPAIECGGGGLPRNLVSEPFWVVDGVIYNKEEFEAMVELQDSFPAFGTVPQPGIYENVPFEVYLSWQALSNSKLKAAARSMLHFREQGPVEETPAMQLGTLCHLGRLEPSALFRRYVVMPDLTKGIMVKGEPAKNPKATNEYERREAEWLTQHQDMKVVDQSQFDLMVGVVVALDRDEKARLWFGCDGPTELSFVWNDPETGILLKARMDKLARRLNMCVDLKTSRDCTRFQSAIVDLGYHRQGAIYLDGWEVLTGEVIQFAIVAVEPSKPFGVMSAPLDEEAIECGRDEYHRTLRQIAECRRENFWPGYKSPDAWRLPGWYLGSTSSESLTLTIGGEKVSL